MPASADVGTNIKNLRASKTKRPKKQILAIALSEARKMGNKSIKPPGRGEAEGSPAEERRESKKKEARERRMGIDKVGKGETVKIRNAKRVGKGEAAGMMPQSPMGGGGQSPMGGGTPPDPRWNYDPITGKPLKPGMPQSPMGGGQPPIGIGEAPGMMGPAMSHMRPNRFASGMPHPMPQGQPPMMPGRPTMQPSTPPPMNPGGMPPRRASAQPTSRGGGRRTTSVSPKKVAGVGGDKKSSSRASKTKR